MLLFDIIEEEEEDSSFCAAAEDWVNVSKSMAAASISANNGDDNVDDASPILSLLRSRRCCLVNASMALNRFACETDVIGFTCSIIVDDEDLLFLVLFFDGVLLLAADCLRAKRGELLRIRREELLLLYVVERTPIGVCC